MFEAFGWVIVSTSLEIFTEDTPLEKLDELDDQVNRENNQLWKNLRQWLATHENIWFKWQFYENLNNIQGVLQFSYARNHKSLLVWELLTWIAQNGTSSYGIVYFHDDESNYSNEYKVLRIVRGKVEEFNDPFLSPIIPVIKSSKYA
ncbi:MAG: Imm7 family immunity protein [Xenococcaceae cyanobacterium MO_167.B27]|nr:Imm7 family immunity protein [Xenococcaceae cyanobacterium MO_167.B27]